MYALMNASKHHVAARLVNGSDSSSKQANTIADGVSRVIAIQCQRSKAGFLGGTLGRTEVASRGAIGQR